LRVSASGTKSDPFLTFTFFPTLAMLMAAHAPHSPRRFVSAVHIPCDPAAHDILVSGGGDSVLKVWEWHAGRRLYDVTIEEAVRPFIAVRCARHKRGYDSGGGRKPPTRRWLARQRRRQAKAAVLAGESAGTTPDREEAGKAEAEIGIEDGGDESGDEAADMVEDETPATPSGEPEEPPVPVLVVQKIETLNVGGRLLLTFSAVGYVVHRFYMHVILTAPPRATALFWFALPLEPAGVPDELPVVHAHDFGRPVVTFAPLDGSPDCIWVSLDAHWTDDGPSPDVTPHVRLVRLRLDSVCRKLLYSLRYSHFPVT
jgi:tRNA (guanine-N(7)-)-methyltransferase subunit TRM82